MEASEILEGAARRIEDGEFNRHAAERQKGTDYQNGHLARRGRPPYTPTVDPMVAAAAYAIGGPACDPAADDARSFLWALYPEDERPVAIHWSEVAAMDFTPLAARLRAAAEFARRSGETFSVALLDASPDHRYHRDALAR